MALVEVAAALIFDGGKFLVCQRPANKARGLKWELAGGKLEEGETGEEALKRECREELGVEIEVCGKFAEVNHRYPDIKIRLTVYLAKIASGKPELREHAALLWITPDEAQFYEFCPADRDILKKIRRIYGGKDGKAKKRTGAKGEKAAAKYLKRHGYKICERNLRTAFGEVDIVAEKSGVTVFCEVKTRTGEDFGAPREAVDRERQARYRRAAQSYMQRRGVCDMRFDVIEVEGKNINHIENAF